MKTWIHWVKSPMRTVQIKRQKYKNNLRRQMLYIKKALEQEKLETKEMLHTYKRYTQKNASKAEMQEANKQFVDIVKGLSLGMVAVLPFAPITIPLILKLGQKVGVDILPSSFANLKNKD